MYTNGLLASYPFKVVTFLTFGITALVAMYINRVIDIFIHPDNNALEWQS